MYVVVVRAASSIQRVSAWQLDVQHRCLEPILLGAGCTQQITCSQPGQCKRSGGMATQAIFSTYVLLGFAG